MSQHWEDILLQSPGPEGGRRVGASVALGSERGTRGWDAAATGGRRAASRKAASEARGAGMQQRPEGATGRRAPSRKAASEARGAGPAGMLQRPEGGGRTVFNDHGLLKL